MTESYRPEAFWDNRFHTYGHTGEADLLLYTHDQPQRLRAIDRALTRAGIAVGAATRILDIGCGMGDLIASLLRRGACEITGIDISGKTLAHARERFSGCRKVHLHAVGVEEMAFPSGAFDLVVAINLLQHVVEEERFARSIENMARVARPGGHLLVMDFSPIRVKDRRPAPHLLIRSRQEYVDAIEGAGSRLVYEFGLPRIGVRLYRQVCGGAVRLIKRLLGRVFIRPAGRGARAGGRDRTRPRGGGEGTDAEAPLQRRSHFHRLAAAALLTLSRPFDSWLAPFPARWTDMRILIFQVSERSTGEKERRP